MSINSLSLSDLVSRIRVPRDNAETCANTIKQQIALNTNSFVNNSKQVSIKSTLIKGK